MNQLQFIEDMKKKKGDFPSTLFAFFKEFHINPLPEEYEVVPVYDGDKIIKLNVKKQAMDISTFGMLIKQLEKHYEEQEKEMERAKRKR